ncbi:hypothetical protein VEE05_44340 [Escherichia coli]|nr:hypothetical protein VEE05_44340 [Escherichia coli]
MEMVFVWKQNYILVDEYFFFCCTWIVNSAHKRISVKVFRVMVFLLLIASGSMLIKGALGIPAAAALLPPFTLLVILQLAFGKKVAAIRRAEESK